MVGKPLASLPSEEAVSAFAKAERSRLREVALMQANMTSCGDDRMVVARANAFYEFLTKDA